MHRIIKPNYSLFLDFIFKLKFYDIEVKKYSIYYIFYVHFILLLLKDIVTD
jgi:hypothetical protein